MMDKKILFLIVFLSNFAPLCTMTYQTSFQRGVDELMKEKILKSSLANAEYEVVDKFFKSELVSDTTGYESVLQVIDRMANIFFTYYQEENLKFHDTQAFIRTAIIKFVDQLFGQESPVLLTSSQREKYASLWDEGYNFDILVESIWSKWQTAGLNNPEIHKFVYDHYYLNKKLMSSFMLESPAEKIARISQSDAFQQMIANFNVPAAKTSTALVASSPVSVSPQAQVATLSAVNSILVRSESDSSVSFTQEDITDAFESVHRGSATPEQADTVLQTAVLTPEVIKQHPRVGSFVTINTLMNLLFVRYGASQSILLDQHNIRQFIEDHPDIFEQLIAQGFIIVSESPSPAERSVVSHVNAAGFPTSLTPEVVTEIVRTVRPVYKNWTLIQSTIAQAAAESLSGMTSTTSPTLSAADSLNLPASAQSVVNVMQQGANELIAVVHQANITSSLQSSKSSKKIAQSPVVLMMPISVAVGDQAQGQAEQAVTTIPLVTTAQKSTSWIQALNNPVPLSAPNQTLVNQRIKQAFGILPSSTNTFDQDLIEMFGGSNDQESTVSLSPVTSASPSSPNLDWLNPSSSADEDDQLENVYHTFVQAVTKNGMMIAQVLLKQNIELVTSASIESVLAEKNIQIDGLSDSSNMAYLIGYVQRCVWLLQQAASAHSAIKVRKIVLVVQQLIKNSEQARS